MTSQVIQFYFALIRLSRCVRLSLCLFACSALLCVYLLCRCCGVCLLLFVLFVGAFFLSTPPPHNRLLCLGAPALPSPLRPPSGPATPATRMFYLHVVIVLLIHSMFVADCFFNACSSKFEMELLDSCSFGVRFSCHRVVLVFYYIVLVFHRFVLLWAWYPVFLFCFPRLILFISF